MKLWITWCARGGWLLWLYDEPKWNDLTGYWVGYNECHMIRRPEWAEEPEKQKIWRSVATFYEELTPKEWKT